MTNPDQSIQIEDLSQPELVKLVPDMIHRIIVHYGMWFHEVRHQMGAQVALDGLGRVFEKNMGLQMARLGRILGFEVKDGLPVALAELPRENLLDLIDGIAKNWIASDGLWFQAIEFEHGMTDAKRCNDSCWAHFSPFEAWTIKRFLDLGASPGLDGLARALYLRIYARLNTQSVIRQDDRTLIFQMNECRVQAARKKKGLDDYPCKSGGLVEYTYFARTIDPRIKTECIGCPPDAHPEQWYCAWKFFID